MKILGIDPGYDRVGVAILDTEPKDTLVHSECIKTNPKDNFTERLYQVGRAVHSLIERHSPEALAIETLLFNTNQKTALKVSEARGVIVYEAMRAGLRIYEYSPLQIKNAVTGYGHASKDQVDSMTRNLVSIEKERVIDDEMDAIAISLTCSASYTQEDMV